MSLDKPSQDPTESSATKAAPPIWKDPLVSFVLGVYFVTVAIMNFLPVTFPVFKRVFSATLEQMGRIQFTYYGSAVVFTLGGGWFVSRLGYKRAIAVTFVVVTASLVLIGSAQSYAVLLVGSFAYGVGILSLSVTTMAIIGEHFGSVRQRLFVLHAICGSAGSVVGPASLGWFLGNAERLGKSWRLGYYFTATITGSLVLWPLLLRSKTLAKESSDAKAKPSAAEAFRHILSQPSMYIIFLLITLHGFTDSGMISFVGQLYQGRLGIDAAQAAYFISSHATGFFMGRLLLSWITARWKIPELLILTACSAGGAFFFGATIVGPSYFSAMLYMGLSGVCVSGNSPSINSYLGMRFQDYAKTAYAFMSGMSYVGAAVGPYIVGYLGSKYGLEKSMWIDPFFSLSLSAVALFWFYRDKSREAPAAIEET